MNEFQEFLENDSTALLDTVLKMIDELMNDLVCEIICEIEGENE